MKKILLLIFGFFVAAAAVCQTPIKGVVETPRPIVEGLTGAYWMQKIRIDVRHNTSYTWIIQPPDQSDSTRFFVSDGKKYKATVVFTEITDLPPVIDEVTVDQSSLTFSPSGGGTINQVNNLGWSNFDSDIAPNPEWCRKFLQGSCAFSDVANANAEYVFTGKRIEVWGEKGPNKGIAGFTLQKEGSPPIAEQTKDLYSTAADTAGPELLFSADFTQGTYTIKMRVTGQKNSAASNAFLLLDYIKFFNQR